MLHLIFSLFLIYLRIFLNICEFNTLVAKSKLQKSFTLSFSKLTIILLVINTFCVYLGSELEIMPDLLYDGAFKHLDLVMVEYHQHIAEGDRIGKLNKLEVAIENLKEIMPEINVLKLDDESYAFEKPPGLPLC